MIWLANLDSRLERHGHRKKAWELFVKDKGITFTARGVFTLSLDRHFT
jgi:hypothetical protein